ncbi:GAF domain-containing protein, partial [candidate division KSB1 bacterium]|nr:GAF domain-containing protein [candidate division KSB1 bacterium]NIV04363.1 GAF domain-containing protein [Calditrichia bacterium]NIS25128.1 GAF domain-containing protein [candidate division KSB1 bacterium]NIU25827.1 GAF domain-containing protein [candidate division KSB1 bacterium]NIV96599.1 GAF domain-containing protein [candidate division KSB1 bacterium]
MPKDYTKKLEFLIEIATLLGQQNDFQEVLRLATQKATTLLNSDMALIMMINPQTRQTLKTIYSEGKEPEERHYHFVHTNVSGWVIDNNRAFFTPDLKSDDRFRKNLFNKIQLSSAACVPLQTEGTTIGTLLLLNKDQNKKFSEDSVAILEKFAAIVSPFLRNTQKIQQYFNSPLPKQAMLRKYEAFGLLGKSKKFVQLLQAIEAASRSEVRVLLEGESGTGKELIAKAIHRLGSRNDQAFLAIDCGAIAANLIESELFGHVKGAFTGATEARKGLFEEANGGILFMDEITNLSLELQSKLLRVLQEGEIRPLGSNRSHKVDVRVIAASRTPLRKLAEQKLFREDLYYRLNVYPISVPSLDDR